MLSGLGSGPVSSRYLGLFGLVLEVSVRQLRCTGYRQEPGAPAEACQAGWWVHADPHCHLCTCQSGCSWGVLRPLAWRASAPAGPRFRCPEKGHRAGAPRLCPPRAGVLSPADDADDGLSERAAACAPPGPCPLLVSLVSGAQHQLSGALSTVPVPLGGSPHVPSPVLWAHLPSPTLCRPGQPWCLSCAWHTSFSSPAQPQR